MLTAWSFLVRLPNEINVNTIKCSSIVLLHGGYTGMRYPRHLPGLNESMLYTTMSSWYFDWGTKDKSVHHHGPCDCFDGLDEGPLTVPLTRCHGQRNGCVN